MEAKNRKYFCGVLRKTGRVETLRMQTKSGATFTVAIYKPRILGTATVYKVNLN